MAKGPGGRPTTYKVDVSMWSFKQDPDYWKVPGYIVIVGYMLTACLFIFGAWHGS